MHNCLHKIVKSGFFVAQGIKPDVRCNEIYTTTLSTIKLYLCTTRFGRNLYPFIRCWKIRGNNMKVEVRLISTREECGRI